MKNELLEKWAEVMGPYYAKEKRWMGTRFFSPPGEALTAVALRRYKGDAVIYIGELGWGCTADDDFHEQLETSWHEVESISLPQWPGIHDGLYVYRR